MPSDDDPSSEIDDDLDESDETSTSDEDEEKGEGEAVAEEEAQFVRGPMPDRRRREMFAIAEQLLGGSRIRVVCEDGRSRMARIPGKMKRRMWIREGDLLIIKPWEFQDEKCDVKYRYYKTQAQYMSRQGVIPDSLDVF